MRIATTLFAATLLALAVPAAAQEVGGLRVAPGAKGGPVGIARPLPVVNTWITAADLQRGMSPTERQSLHQGMISRLRGDAGFLGGFSFGQPVAPSRQVQVADDGGFGFDGGFVDGGFVPDGGRPRTSSRSTCAAACAGETPDISVPPAAKKVRRRITLLRAQRPSLAAL